MKNYSEVFADRHRTEDELVGNCLYYLRDAIKAIQVGNLSKEQIQKICTESLQRLFEAINCRKETFRVIEEWENEHIEERRKRIAKRNSRFKHEWK